MRADGRAAGDAGCAVAIPSVAVPCHRVSIAIVGAEDVDYRRVENDATCVGIIEDSDVVVYDGGWPLRVESAAPIVQWARQPWHSSVNRGEPVELPEKDAILVKGIGWVAIGEAVVELVQKLLAAQVGKGGRPWR